jgi:hypothetical protein
LAGGPDVDGVPLLPEATEAAASGVAVVLTSCLAISWRRASVVVGLEVVGSLLESIF